MEDFEYRGDWWLPEDPDNVISGTLTYAPRAGARLALIGSFKDVNDRSGYWEFSRHPLILGLTTAGKKITLYRCAESETHHTNAGLVSSYRAIIVIAGFHFSCVEDLTFKNLSFGYSHLEEWTTISGFTDKISQYPSGRLRRIAITYVPPRIISAQVDDMKLNIGFGFSSNPRRYRERQIEQHAYIQLAPQREMHIDWLNERFDLVQQLLSLGMSEVAVPTFAIAQTSRAKWRLDERRLRFENLELFYALSATTPEVEELYAPQMLFTLQDMQDDLGVYLWNWFAKASDLKPVFDLYFGTQYNQSLYPYLQLLSYAQAAEAYCRRAEPQNQYVSDAEYDAVREAFTRAIPPGLPAAFRDSLMKKIEYMNEYSLRKRLLLLLRKHADAVTMFNLDDKTLRDQFIADVVDTRNYLTHYDPQSAANAKQGQELRTLVVQLRFLIEVCLMSTLGFPEAKIGRIMARNQQYGWEVQRRNELLAARTVARQAEGS